MADAILMAALSVVGSSGLTDVEVSKIDALTKTIPAGLEVEAVAGLRLVILENGVLGGAAMQQPQRNTRRMLIACMVRLMICMMDVADA